MAQDLRRLLRPRSVAIVGASDKPGSLGASVLANLERWGFDGAIHLVNSKRAAIGGRPCLPSTADLPEGIDAAVLAVPKAGVLPALRDLAARRTGAAVVLSAGFAEEGEAGRAEQRAIARLAATADMVVEGPNCLGHVNFVDGVPLTFIETPRVPAPRGPGIAILSQSGAMAAVIGTVLQSRGLPLSWSVSTGNEAVLGVERLIDHLGTDPSVSLVALVVEQFRDPARFLRTAEAVRATGRDVILLHPGRSAAARQSAATHTGAMAGDWEVMRVKVERAGVLLVETVEELGDCVELVQRYGRVTGRGVAVAGESGAFKALSLDLAERVGLPLPVLADADSPALRAALPPFVPVGNPVDMTAQTLVDPGLYGRVLEALVEDDRIDLVILGLIQTDAATAALKFPPVIEALRSLAGRKPVVIAGLDDGAPVAAEFIQALQSLGVTYFPSPERAMRAVARLLGRRAPVIAPGVGRTGTGVPLPGPGVLPEHRAKRWLAQAGIAFPPGRLAGSLDEAKAIAAAIGWPVVLKAQAVDLPHKSEAGGVAVGIGDEAALAAAWDRMARDVARTRPSLALDGILVEAMAPRGVELIVGGRGDPEWGPVLLVGFGGIQAEAARDVRLLAPDLSLDAIEAEIGRLAAAPLLHGFRGAPPCDMAAVARIVRTVGDILLAHQDIAEIDLNPVVVGPDGALALDALLVIGAQGGKG